MNSKQVIRLLQNDGWVGTPGKGGSHRQYIHPSKPGKVTVAFHGTKELPPKTLNSILKQAGLK